MMRYGEAAGKKILDEERSGVLEVTQIHESLEHHPTVTKSIGVVAYFGDGYCIVKKFSEFSTAYAFASVFCFEPKEKNSSI